MSHDPTPHSENHFYRGLFFGLILGVGVLYFLKTKEGQKVKRELLNASEELIEDLSDRVIEFLEEKPTP